MAIFFSFLLPPAASYRFLLEKFRLPSNPAESGPELRSTVLSLPCRQRNYQWNHSDLNEIRSFHR
jgi:hypothetical protein